MLLPETGYGGHTCSGSRCAGIDMENKKLGGGCAGDPKKKTVTTGARGKCETKRGGQRTQKKRGKDQGHVGN